MKTYLPIGSVVLLKEASKRIMIVGVAQIEAGTGKIWDYSAVPYPDGMIDSNRLVLFNEDQIHTHFFVVFQDSEGIQFHDSLSSNDQLNQDPNQDIHDEVSRLIADTYERMEKSLHRSISSIEEMSRALFYDKPNLASKLLGTTNNLRIAMEYFKAGDIDTFLEINKRCMREIDQSFEDEDDLI